MTASEYLSNRAAYDELCRVIEARTGAGPLDRASVAGLASAAAAESRALAAMANTPAQSLAEIAERAAVLSGLIDQELWQEHLPALAARIAADLSSILPRRQV